VSTLRLDRRRFLAVSLAAGGALLVGIRSARAEPTPDVPPELLGDDLTPLGPFLRIERDNRIVIGARGCEVGQGVLTALPMLIAEELDVAWAQVRVVQLPYGYTETPNGSSNRYGRQGSAASEDVAASWRELRVAGATARWLLLQAAAREWSLPAARLQTTGGHVVAPDGRRLSYGALARSAASIPPPRQPVALKSPRDFQVVGTPTRTADAREVVSGRAPYGIDSYAADALVAVVARCPHLGGTLGSFDDAEARRVAGVVDVIALPAPDAGDAAGGALAAGIAVVAQNTWAALQGRERLAVTWTPGRWEKESTSALAAAARALLDGDAAEGLAVRRDGDFASARKQARQVVEARYQVPFLAHATMEPPSALLELRKDGARLTAAVQDPDGASGLVARLTGLPRGAIEIRLVRGGGSFGRRLHNDYVAEAVRIAQAAGKPVKLMWTREDDLQHDFYRPLALHALVATLDRRKRLTGWSHRCAAKPPSTHEPAMAGLPPNAGCLDADAFPAGLVANLDATFHALESGMPRGGWRALLQASQVFAVQGFIDEVAIASKQDALALRLALLGEPRNLPAAAPGGTALDTGRLANVLRRCAERIGWGVRRADGHGIGIACHAAHGGHVAHGFEVSVEGGRLVIHRVVCSVDIGRVVNPLGVEGEVMGTTIAAISDALGPAITVREGQVQQHNFPDYPLLRLGQSPRVLEVDLVESTADPATSEGIAMPGAAPALANAIHAATTVRVRRMPMLPELMRML
jgi:isoquinoline 1-oxidoreductase beta subunit